MIGFNAVLMSEHFGAFFAFVVLHVALLVVYVKRTLPPRQFWLVVSGVVSVAAAALAAGVAVVAGYVLRSPTLGWTGERAGGPPRPPHHLTSGLRSSAHCGATAVRGPSPSLNTLESHACAGRSLSLLDPTYASRFIPIIASVSEHQPPNWSSYIMDLHVLVAFVPAGIMACFTRRSDGSIFLILYGVTAVYFSGVMVRFGLGVV